MKKAAIGMLAHVDAGKTTLTEALLFTSGKLQKMGRVDNGNAFLDTNLMEKERGITIFSKQAVFVYKDTEFTLVDTPGHVDFATETERALQILNYAILVISGAEGVQSHTRTLWNLLRKYQIPTFLFINKMDHPSVDRELLIKSLKKELSEGCIDFTRLTEGSVNEQAALTEEDALNEFLQNGYLQTKTWTRLISERHIFPVFFGSALKSEGVSELLEGLCRYTKEENYNEEFGARVYKIMRDNTGNRLTCMKIIGGTLHVKDILGGEDGEKVNQIRIYSGEKYETVLEAEAGSIVTVTGPKKTRPGQGLGFVQESETSVLEPVLTYAVKLTNDVVPEIMYTKFKQLEEEEPKLQIEWNEVHKEIRVRVMGEVQMEILERMVADRFGVKISFGQGKVIYKETILSPVLGAGHFEPLKHYAEVHLLLEPGEQSSGMQYSSSVSEDDLSRNWQRLIISMLEEKEHKGVLLGAGVTDIKVTLVAGRAHLKHTEGGDFRQAAYRALRQGLYKAESILLEPYFQFTINVPKERAGRVMTDIQGRYGNVSIPEMDGQNAVLTGRAPVATIWDYQKEITVFTQGSGTIIYQFAGYFPCHNAEEVIEASNYSPDEDLENPGSSVFCAHGAGFLVPWDEADSHMHVELENELKNKFKSDEETVEHTERRVTRNSVDKAISLEEIEQILAKTYHANKKKQSNREELQLPEINGPIYRGAKKKEGEEYLLVDGYNIVFAWDELNEIAKTTLDGARGRLLDLLCDYQAQRGCHLIVVFDAYRVKGQETKTENYHNIQVVFTKEAQTADSYIERFAHENGQKHRIIIATSDGLEQMIIRGAGCELFSAREFLLEVEASKKWVRENYNVIY